MMNLQKYIEIEKIKPGAFAKLLNISATQLNQYIYGKTIPRPGVMMKIFIITKGLVSADDFYGTTKDVLENELAKNSKRIVEN
jgi:DNA-binding transcriptional regulator YdaS (Cro superfamily)